MNDPLWPVSLVEGDYLETVEGFFFAVKGLSHPKGLTIAYLRYIPDPQGERVREGLHYRRVYSLGETTDFLAENYPVYLNQVESKGLVLQTVPESRIRRVYSPRDHLREISEKTGPSLEEAAVKFTSQISRMSGIPVSRMGLTGSSLIGLTNANSDLDLIAYGEEECRRIYKALVDSRTSGLINAYDPASVGSVLKNRWGDTGLDLQLFRDIEIDKVLHGFAYGREYFWRLLKSPVAAEVSEPLGTFTVNVSVLEDCDSFFTPCRYKVESMGATEGTDISELFSYRGKFTEQAKTGDTITARGTLEKVVAQGSIYHRLILGGPGDYMLPSSLLDR